MSECQECDHECHCEGNCNDENCNCENCDCGSESWPDNPVDSHQL
jgi:hypothetical protein